jgi:hypothetical protein
MNSKKYREFLEAYNGIYEQVGVQVPGKDPEDVLSDIIKDPKYGGGKVIKSKGSKSSGLVKAAEEYNVYDEVLEYLLGEGYTEEESNLIMVQLVTEGGFQDVLKGVRQGTQGAIKAVQQRTGIGKPGVGPGQVARNIVKAGINDILGTSIATGSTPSSVGVAKPVPSVTKSPTPVVRAATKAPRTAPKGVNKITTNVWNEPSAPSSRINPSKPSGPKVTSTRALSGAPSRPALPAAGQTTASAKPSKPTLNRQALPQPKPTAQRGGALVSTRGAKPTFNPAAVPQSKPTAQRGGALVSTRAPKGDKPTLNRQALPQPKPTAQRGGALVSTKTSTPKPSTPAAKPTQTRSQQYQDVQRLNKMTGGGAIGTREVSSNTHRAPKPAWGSGAKTPKPAAAKPSPVQAPKPVDKVTPKPANPSIKSRKPGKLDSLPDLGGKQGFTPPVGGPHVAAAALGLQAYNTADATRKSAPKFPTTAKEVKKGETYYDPKTRVGSSQRFAQRKKVGPGIVGPGKVGTEAQSFDKAYGAAKAKGGMGSTFKWKGKDYKVS